VQVSILLLSEHKTANTQKRHKTNALSDYPLRAASSNFLLSFNYNGHSDEW